MFGQERKDNKRVHCRQYIRDLLWPSTYQRERPAPDKDNSLPDVTPALATPLNSNIAVTACTATTRNTVWRLEGVMWPHSATRHMFRWRRRKKRKECGSEMGTEQTGRVQKGGRVSVYEDDQHHLLFTSPPIYTLTQTESISQSPDILPTPLCKGKSPWRSLVGVGDRTHTHACCEGLTAAWRQEASTAETPPNWHLVIILVYRVGLALLNYTHASAHTLSHIPSHANTHTYTHTLNSPTQTSFQPEKSWKSS